MFTQYAKTIELNSIKKKPHKLSTVKQYVFKNLKQKTKSS